MFLHLYSIPSSKEKMDELRGSIDHGVSYVDNDLSSTFEAAKEENVNICLVKENVESDRFLRAYLKYCNQEKKFCSHVMLMENASHRFILTDCVMNIDPSPSDLVKIVENAIYFHQLLDDRDLIDATIHVNLLTNNGHFSLKNPTSCKMALVEKELEYKNYANVCITKWQLDACLYSDARKAKGLGDWLFNTPDIIVVPNLDTGNAIYKALMKQYRCYGFVIGGTTPAILNSRSDLDKNEECINILKEHKIVK